MLLSYTTIGFHICILCLTAHSSDPGVLVASQVSHIQQVKHEARVEKHARAWCKKAYISIYFHTKWPVGGA